MLPPWGWASRGALAEAALCESTDMLTLSPFLLLPVLLIALLADGLLRVARFYHPPHRPSGDLDRRADRLVGS
jgi:hypothetical protein